MSTSLRQGGRIVVVATILSGSIGYLLTTLTARFLGDDYARFAVFWATLFVAVGAIAGIQQEFSRSMSAESASRRGSGPRADVVALAAAIVVALVVAVLLVPFAGSLFAPEATTLSALVVAGVFFSALTLAATGMFYGHHSWYVVAFMSIGDAVFRVIGFLIANASGGGISGFALATIIPFMATMCIALIITRRGYLGGLPLDGGYSQVATRVGRSILASVGLAVIVNGMPLAIEITSHGVTASVLGAVFLVMTLTRAPLVVGAVAIQSYIVIAFRDSAGHVLRRVFIYVGLVTGIGIILAVIAGVVGPPLISWISGPQFALSPLFFGLVTLSSVTTAWVVITGAATLSQRHHTAYALGWVVSAAVTAALFLLPIPLETRVIVGFTVGPLPGAVVHLATLRRHATTAD